MKVRYSGPEGQTSWDVAAATGKPAELRRGEYDVPDELGRRLVASSEHWSATELADLTVDQLRELARQNGIENFSKLKKDELVATLEGGSE